MALLPRGGRAHQLTDVAARGPPHASQEDLFVDDASRDEALVVDAAPPDEFYLVDPPSDNGLPEFDIDTASLG